MKKLIETEKQIKDSIIHYLKLKGYYVQRLNAGMYRLEKSFVMGVVAGTPDILAFRTSPHLPQGTVQLYFIEVKRNKKMRATELQVAKMKELEKFGARCLVATSVSDLQEAGL